MQINLTGSDAWLLFSIGLAGRERSASLKEIIATGDTVNKAIFTPQELRRGLAKLMAAGYVSEESGGFRLSQRGEQVLGQASERASRLLDQLGEVEKLIGSTPWAEWNDPRFEDPRWSHPSITDEAVATAFSEYQAEFEQARNRLARTPGV